MTELVGVLAAPAMAGTARVARVAAVSTAPTRAVMEGMGDSLFGGPRGCPIGSYWPPFARTPRSGLPGFSGKVKFVRRRGDVVDVCPETAQVLFPGIARDC